MSGYDYSQEVANELLEASDVELESLRQQLAECHATNGKLREALDAVQQVANRSEGIAGWHLNGDIASWDSILPEVDEALAISNDATALNELITERTKTQKEYYESVFQDGANRIAELNAEVERLKSGVVCGDCDGSGWLENRVEGRHPCTCMTEAEPYQLLIEQNAELTAEVERLMAEHQAACELVAKMHAAAVGEITGPKRGVVEDVADAIAKLRDELETERMRLAGCGVAALGYFDGCCDTYKSASLDDVLRLRDRNAELTAENRELRMSRSLRQEQHDGEIAELTAQRDALLAFAASYIAAWNNGSTGDSDIFFMAESAIANCKEPGK